jgi:hypothetical protein
MVFPFKINSKKLEIRLSVWILLLCRVYSERETDGAGSSIGEITINAVGEKRRWVFSIKNPGGPGAKTRVLALPPYREAVRRKTEGEIREVLGDFGGAVSLEMSAIPEIRDGDGFFTWPLFFAEDGGFFPVEEEA